MKILRHWGAQVVFLGLLGLSPLRAETIVDDPGRFSIDIPQPVERSTSETTSGLGNTTMHFLVHEVDKATAYILSYNDYPPGSVAKMDQSKPYDDIVQGVVDSLKGKIRSNVAHKLGDANGREYVIDNEKDKFAAWVRCYFVGDRLYQIMVIGPPGIETAKESLHFMESLRLLR